MAKNVIPFNLTAPAALKRIRELAGNSANVFVVEHAKKRMKERHVTLSQVLECLQKGRIVEGPYKEVGGVNWRVRVEYYLSGQCVAVVAELYVNENNEKLIVITTFLGA